MTSVDPTYLSRRRQELRLESHERALRGILIDLWPTQIGAYSGIQKWVDELPSRPNGQTSQLRIATLCDVISRGMRNDWWLP